MYGCMYVCSGGPIKLGIRPSEGVGRGRPKQVRSGERRGQKCRIMCAQLLLSISPSCPPILAPAFPPFLLVRARGVGILENLMCIRSTCDRCVRMLPYARTRTYTSSACTAHARAQARQHTFPHAHTSCVGILWPAASEQIHRPPNKPSSNVSLLVASWCGRDTQEKAHGRRTATVAHNGLRATIIRYMTRIILNLGKQALRDTVAQVAPRHFDFLRCRPRHG